jgi:ribosomal subunit interface protein
MNLKATNMELNSVVKAQAEEKLGSLDKYYNNIVQTDVELGKITRGQNKGDIYFCEINVSVPHKLLRYRTELDSLDKAITATKHGIIQEIVKYKEQN